MAILKTPKTKSGILAQGLWLVLLPFLCNCLLVFILSGALTKAETQIETSRRQITVLHKLTHTMYAVTEILMGGNNAMMNGSFSFFGPLINQGWTAIESDLADVSNNTTHDAGYEKFKSDFDSLLHRQQAIFLKGDDHNRSFDNVFVKMRRVGEWVKIGGKESRVLNDFQKSIQEKYLQTVQQQREDQNFTDKIVIAGLIANTLLALILNAHFHRNFMARISALSKMAQKLPRNEPINEAISGTDELQEIGLELAKVSWRLADVAEYRRSLMQMMAHDIRSPLMAADISISTMEKFLDGSLSDEGNKNLSKAGQALSNCLSLVNDLLLLESLDNGEYKPDLQVCDLEELVITAVEDERFISNTRIGSFDENLIVRVDQKQITLTIERMLESAIQRSPQNKIEIKGVNAKDRVELHVIDHAESLTKEKREQLFDKMHQATASDGMEASSLGLAIGPSILALHHGSIYFDSASEGNLLVLELPIFESSKESKK